MNSTSSPIIYHIENKNHKINKFNPNFGTICSLLRDEKFSQKDKLAIYKTVLNPFLMYGSETWQMTKKKSKRQTTEMSTETNSRRNEMRKNKKQYG